MDKKRMFRNGELVDVYYDENGEEYLIHWVYGVPRNSGRYPWPKTNNSNKFAHENAHEISKGQ